MIQTYETYSLKKKKNRVTDIFLFLFKLFLILFLFYFVVTTFFLSSYKVKSVSMSPGINQNESLLTSPLVSGIRFPFLKHRFKGIKSLERADVVVVIAPEYPELQFFGRLFDYFVRFLSLNQGSTVFDTGGQKIGKYILKRVIGIPGDTVKVTNFVAHIKQEQNKK